MLDLLVLDGANPRSVMFQTEGVHSALMKLETAYGPCGSELFGPAMQALEGSTRRATCSRRTFICATR